MSVDAIGLKHQYPHAVRVQHSFKLPEAGLYGLPGVPRKPTEV